MLSLADILLCDMVLSIAHFPHCLSDIKSKRHRAGGELIQECNCTQNPSFHPKTKVLEICIFYIQRRRKLTERDFLQKMQQGTHEERGMMLQKVTSFLLKEMVFESTSIENQVTDEDIRRVCEYLKDA